MGVIKDDLVGKRFGMLIAVRYLGMRTWKPMGGYRKSFWECKCDCGNIVEVYRGSLTGGRTTSCGCRGKEDWESNFCNLYHNRRKTAMRFGHEWHLTKEQFLFLTSQPCHYCGRPPLSVQKTPKYRGQYLYNGVDRVDNNIDYVFENCVTCCEHCNRAKLDYTVEDFKSWAVRVYNHWAGKSDL